MRTLFIILLSAITITGYSQDVIKGGLYNYKNKKPVKLLYQTEIPKICLTGQSKIDRYYKVEKNGTFSVPVKDFDSLGNVVEFYVFNGFFKDYADFKIINIPRDSLALVLSKVFLKPAYWTTQGSDDSFFINNKATFRDSSFVVDNGLVKYLVKRYPMKIKLSTLDVKYLSDFRTDIIK